MKNSTLIFVARKQDIINRKNYVKGTSACRGKTSVLTREAIAFKLAACNAKAIRWIVEIGENEIEKGRSGWT